MTLGKLFYLQNLSFSICNGLWVLSLQSLSEVAPTSLTYTVLAGRGATLWKLV